MLSAIYIKGFKTFARPVRMPLEGGVTVIVGPNGSGKSNITDAVLFALGEQSPSVLRAGGMGDVIFSGSETLSAAAAAEVTLVFDNSSGRISLPYEEVSVTRRISRGGDTEYLINGARSRLADVRAIAGEAGLGRHSILRQGAVDAIVSGGASACRAALEEAAGLGVYRRRRVAASRRLERADAQLERSRQLEAELAGQLRRIEEEAKAAREYRELEARHRKLSLAHLYRVATQDLDSRRRNLEDREARESGLSVREESLREERAAVEPRLQEVEARLREHERALESLEDLAEGARTGSLRAERSALRLESTASEERGRSSARLRDELERMERALVDLGQKAALLERECSGKRRNLSRLKEEESAARKRHEEARDRQSRLAGTLERLRARRGRESDEEIPSSPGEELEQIVEEPGSIRWRDLRDGLDALISGLERHKAAASDLAADIEGRRGALSAAEGSVEVRIRNLSAPEENANGVRLYQVVRARPGFEAAVEAALGELGEGVLAEDLDEGIRLLSGREKVAVRLDARGMDEAHAPGTPLLECVEVVDESYAEAVERILAGIYVVESPDEDAPNNGFIAVTQSGLRLTRTSVSLSGGGRFEREARLSREKERLDALKNGPAVMLDGLRAELSAAGSRVDGLLARTGAARALAARSERASSLVVGEAKRRRKRAEAARERRARLREEAESIERGISTTEEELRQTGSALRTAQTRLSSASSAAEAAREESGRAEQRRRRLRASIAEAERRRDRVSGALRRLESPSNSDRLAGLAERALRGSKAVTDAVLARRNRLRRARSEASDNHRHLAAEQNRLASQETGLASELAQARAEVQRAREELKRAERGAEEAEERIRSEWGATLEMSRRESGSVTGDIEPERNRLARRIKNFGDVNLLALSQESQLRERHEFVSSQRADAEAASADLDRIIRNVDREIEARFDRTFERVREAFRGMVPTMMRGSSGDLELSEEGVEISLRLGRRGRRPLQVLSGGERSLLALSFLFGIFLGQRQDAQRTFCMLDEAEAALDDVNLARFLAVVDSHKVDGQFLLVTHQKRTMAAADVLYGVTQDASGATVVVSKRLSGE